jgi:hypothetical protein
LTVHSDQRLLSSRNRGNPLQTLICATAIRSNDRLQGRRSWLSSKHRCHRVILSSQTQGRLHRQHSVWALLWRMHGGNLRPEGACKKIMRECKEIRKRKNALSVQRSMKLLSMSLRSPRNIGRQRNGRDLSKVLRSTLNLDT